MTITKVQCDFTAAAFFFSNMALLAFLTKTQWVGVCTMVGVLWYTMVGWCSMVGIICMVYYGGDCMVWHGMVGAN